jgi:hypothetical protein
MRFPDGLGDPFEGILHFPDRWDALAKASHLRVDTALPWAVEYDAGMGRFRVVLEGVGCRQFRRRPAIMRRGHQVTRPARVCYRSS